MGAALLPTGIGAGVGLLGDLFGGNKGQQQSTIDPALAAYLQRVRGLGMDAYMGLSAPQISPDFLNAMKALGGYAGAGQNAMDMLTGKANIGAAMNPYTSAMDPVFARMRASAMGQTRNQNTMMGMVPGSASRAALAESASMRDINQAQGQFNYQGWQDTMNRLLNVAGLGASAAGQEGSMGQWQTMLPLLWQSQRMGLLTPGLMSAGSTSTIPNSTNWFQGMLGGGLAGASLGGFNFGGKKTGGGLGPGGPAIGQEGQ